MVSILEAKKAVEDILLTDYPNVTGVGLSTDWSEIIVYVASTTDPSVAEIPPAIAGYPVVVMESGVFKPFLTRVDKIRPIIGGISVGHFNITAGTISCFIQDNVTGKDMVLSNNHVLAACDADTNPVANVGDDIYQPGKHDGGTIYDTVAGLTKWIAWDTSSNNIVDCAGAETIVPFVNRIFGDSDTDLVEITGTRAVSLGETVHKYGRTSGHTWGTISSTDATVNVQGTDRFGNALVARFTDQLVINMYGAGGDSGSLILDSNNRAVGLLFAGGEDAYGNTIIIANKINNVLAMLDSHIYGLNDNPPPPPPPPDDAGGAILAGSILLGCLGMINYGLM